MSGRSKRILYYICDAALFLALGGGGLIAVAFLTARESDWGMVALCLALLAVLIRLPVFLHECGHLIFGTLAGMELAAFRFSLFENGCAMTAMFPKNGRRVKGKFLAFTLGGAALDLLAGGILLALWLALPAHPVTVFCGCFSGFCLYEGVRALLPAELPAGKTDGAVLFGLLKKAPEEEIALRVLEAQGILFGGSFSDLKRERLFETPVVREDLPAYHALLLLRAQYLLAAGEEDAAHGVLLRLSSLAEELAPEELEEAVRYLGYFAGVFRKKKSPLAGVNALEARMEQRKQAED